MRPDCAHLPLIVSIGTDTRDGIYGFVVIAVLIVAPSGGESSEGQLEPHSTWQGCSHTLQHPW